MNNFVKTILLVYRTDFYGLVPYKYFFVRDQEYFQTNQITVYQNEKNNYVLKYDF